MICIYVYHFCEQSMFLKLTLALSGTRTISIVKTKYIKKTSKANLKSSLNKL